MREHVKVPRPDQHSFALRRLALSCVFPPVRPALFLSPAKTTSDAGARVAHESIQIVDSLPEALESS